MFDAYSVFVKVGLVNQVSAGLATMSAQFKGVDAQVAILQTRLNNMKKTLMWGAGMFASGFMGLSLIDKMMKPGEDFAHQMNILKMAGLDQKDIAEATGKAWQVSGKLLTLTATDALKNFNDLRIVLGDTKEALAALEPVSQAQAVLMSSKEGRSQASDANFAFSMAKAIDIEGKTISHEEFIKQMLLMTQDITAFQGRVTPKMFQQTFAYARQATYGLNDRFKFRILPTLMMEYTPGTTSASGGGGSRGVGPGLSQLNKILVQGQMNRQSMAEWSALGLVDTSQALNTTTTGTTIANGVKGASLANQDYFEWAQRYLRPAIDKKYGGHATNEQIGREVALLFRGSQIGGQFMTQFLTQPFKFLRDENITKQAKFSMEAYKNAIISDPQLAQFALKQQWDNVLTSLTYPLVTVLIPALIKVSSGFYDLSQVLYTYPGLSKVLMYSLLGLSGALAFSGTVLILKASFQALSLVMSSSMLTMMTPIIGISVAAGLAAYALYKLYGIIKEFIPETLIKGLKDGVQNHSWLNTATNNPYVNRDLYAAHTADFYKNHAQSHFWDNIGHNVSSFFSIQHWKEAFNNILPSHITNPNKQMQMAQIKPILSVDVATPKKQTHMVQVNSHIHLDGKKIGNAVTNHIVSQARTPNINSRFDTNMSYTPPLVGQGNY